MCSMRRWILGTLFLAMNTIACRTTQSDSGLRSDLTQPEQPWCDKGLKLVRDRHLGKEALDVSIHREGELCSIEVLLPNAKSVLSFYQSRINAGLSPVLEWFELSKNDKRFVKIVVTTPECGGFRAASGKVFAEMRKNYQQRYWSQSQVNGQLHGMNGIGSGLRNGKMILGVTFTSPEALLEYVERRLAEGKDPIREIAEVEGKVYEIFIELDGASRIVAQ